MIALTGAFFKFPIKIYNREEVADVLHKFTGEDIPNPNDIPPPSWAQGWVRVPFNDVLTWGDDTVNPEDVSKIAKNGFDATYVKTRNCGDFECLWSREKFEKNLDEAYNAYRESVMKEEAAEKILKEKFGKLENI